MRLRDSKPAAKTDAASAPFRGAWALPNAWHLLSLDAPTVAVTWCSAFVRGSDREGHVTRLRAAALFLVLATWLCYVGDRILDARSSVDVSRFRARHRFYGMLWNDRQAAVLAAIGLGALACVVTALRGLDFSLLESYAALTAISVTYFGWVHLGESRAIAGVSKEAVVGTIFAVGCLLPAWTESSREVRRLLLPEGLLFAVLCWLNCVAIERWEGRERLSPLAHPSTQWAAAHLGRLLVSGAMAASGLVVLHHNAPAHALVALSLASAFALLGLLEASRRSLSANALRILADAALLTPIPWLAAGVAT